MHQINMTSARRLASDIKHAHAAVDTALIHMTRLATNMLEVGAETGLAAADSQKAIEAAAEGITGMVAGRNRIVRMHRQMASLKDQSNLAVTDLGCLPGPLAGTHLSAVG
jgi:hypothetical protein